MKKIKPFEALEQEFGEWVGAKNVVGCATGSAALHLAFESMIIPRHTEVIVPDYTMVACARAVSMSDLKPVFVDCDESLQMNLERVKETITMRTSAILAVPIYGRCCDWFSLYEIAQKNGIRVIEDRAEYHLPYERCDLKPAAACWSFYKNKVIAGEEGGAVAFRSLDDSLRAKQLRCMGFTEDHDFRHVPRGWNYRLSNAHAKLILASLRAWKENYSQRKAVEGYYNEVVPEEWKMPERDVVWVYDVKVPGITLEQKSEVIRRMNRFGIRTRHGFQPMTSQPEFYQARQHTGEVARRMAREVFYFDVSPLDTRERAHENTRTLKAVVFDVLKGK